MLLISLPNVFILKREICHLYSDLANRKVFEMVYIKSFADIIPELSDDEMRLYLYKLLQALDYSHSVGIIHRDVKPRNIVVNPNSKELRLIDWGLSEYYLPDKEYNVRVASRPYKGPELLVNLTLYDYSLDLWSFGCVLGGMVSLQFSILDIPQKTSVYGKEQSRSINTNY